MANAISAHAQYPSNPSGRYNGYSTGAQTQYDQNGRPLSGSQKPKQDSIEHRDKYADSITIFYKYFDSTRIRTIDSSINDFSKRIKQPYWLNTLGNYGTATNSLLFQPYMKPGWDEGLHQFDAYNFTVENTRFFQTTRPYTELGYLLGSKAEQLVDILHTQNKKSNFNFSFEYRFSNSPGLFRLQNASINNLRFTTHYQSHNKRYESFLIYYSNKNAVSENGGLVNPNKSDSITGNTLSDPYQLLTRLGQAGTLTRDPFNTTVNTGNIYKEMSLLYRQQYDFGQKDSIVVNDSVTARLFYARFRLQHTFSLKTNSYQFLDFNADSLNYDSLYHYKLTKMQDTVQFKDAWINVTNEFSLLSFPDKKNQSQFLKVGTIIQNFKGNFGDTSSQTFHNISLLGEYRNRTRNQLWDMQLKGELYVNGMNSGDYGLRADLKRALGRKVGYLQIGFQNVNKTPSFIFDPLTNFRVTDKQAFKKINFTRLYAVYENPKQHFILSGEYYLVNNYTYFDSFFVAKQDASLFNVLHVSAEKSFKLSKHWTLYSELHLQQTTNNAPVHVPFLLTRNRLAYEGNFFTNLNLSTGIEVRYYTNYKADNYSPFTGQFFYQNNFITSNLPDINLFFDFRIKSFKAFIRAENLNTLNSFKQFSFTKYSFATPYYPSQGLWMRLGIWWSFVN